MAKTVNLNCQMTNEKYVDQGTLDRVIEKVRSGYIIQLTIACTGSGSLKDHLSAACRSWRESIKPYDVNAKVSEFTVVEAMNSVILRVEYDWKNHEPDWRRI